MKKLYFTIFVLFNFGSMFSMKEELDKRTHRWIQENPTLLSTLRSRKLSLAAKNEVLAKDGYRNASDYNYVLPVLFDAGDVVFRIPSERTRFVNYLCSLGLEQKLNEGKFTKEEITELRKKFEEGEGQTQQGISQARNYQLLVAAYQAQILNPELLLIPYTALRFYPDVEGKPTHNDPSETNFSVHDDTMFILQQYVQHTALTNAEVAELSLEQLQEISKCSWVGRLWNTIKSDKPKSQTNIGRTPTGQLVITDLEKPDRLLPTDDPSRADIFVINGLEGLLKVLPAEKRVPLANWMALEFAQKCAQGKFNSQTYLLNMLKKYSA